MKKIGLILFGIILPVFCLNCGGGGGGDGAGGASGAGSAGGAGSSPGVSSAVDIPSISNLSYTPQAANRNGATVPITCTVDATDVGGNVSTMNLTVFNSSGGQVWTDDAPVTLGSGRTSATLDFPATAVGKYTFKVSVTDARGDKSGALEGTFSIVDAWLAKTPMPTARDSGMAGAVDVAGQTKVYVIGGMEQQVPLKISNAVAEYDPATNTWNPNAKAAMSTARTDHNAAVVDNKIYVFGGYDVNRTPLNSVEVYDPQTDVWAPRSNMPVARHDFGVAVIDKKIYLIGGLLSQNEETGRVDIYDPATDTWDTSKPAMPTKRAYLAVAAVDRNIYAIGGSLANDRGLFANVEVFDVDRNTWTTKAPLPTARDEMAVAVVNGKIWVIGGWDVPGAQIPSNKVEVYDPVSNTWAGKAALPEPWAPDFNTAVLNGKVYVFGGIDEQGKITNRVQVYDPSIDIQ